MMKRLILSKTNTKDSAKRPLCLAITRAVSYLEQIHEQREAGLRIELIGALAGAAVYLLGLQDIYNLLAATPNKLLEWTTEYHEKRYTRARLLYPEREIRDLKIVDSQPHIKLDQLRRLRTLRCSHCCFMDEPVITSKADYWKRCQCHREEPSLWYSLANSGGARCGRDCANGSSGN
jgi:hypothetical protein